MAIHDRLKYARQRAGLSLAQVKQRADIGESSLCEFENGKREPSLSQLQKLAGVYRRSGAFFLGRSRLLAKHVASFSSHSPAIVAASADG